jgi:L-fucose isomerase-like protein
MCPLQVRDKPRIGFLPVGLFRNESLKKDYQLGLDLVRQLDAHVVESPLVWSQPDVLDNVASLQAQGIDLLVLYVLNGMSAEQQTLAGVKSQVPTVLWALPTNYSFASAVSAIGALRDRGHRARLVVADEDPSSVLPEIDLMARAAFTISHLQQARLGTLGGIFPNLPAASYHPDILADTLGPQVIHIPIAMLSAFLSGIDETECQVDQYVQRLKQKNEVRVDRDLLNKAIRFHLALKRLVSVHRLTGVVMECHTELTPMFGINPCLGYADPDRDYLIGCEGDVLAAVNVLLMWLLVGREPCLGDVYSVRDGIVTLFHCGAACGASTAGEAVILEQAAPDNPGLQMSPDTKMAMCIPILPPGEVTLTRLHGQKCNQMHVAAGTLIEADAAERLKLRIRLHQPEAFVQQVCGNHYVMSYGDARPGLRVVCEWLGINLTET